MKNTLGINLAQPADWSTEIPFIDCFRQSQEWVGHYRGGLPDKGPQLERDNNGWIRRLEPNSYAEALLFTSEKCVYPAGHYVCLYEGEGKIQFGNAAREIARRPGRIELEVKPKKGGISLQIHGTNPQNYIRNIRVLLPGQESRFRRDLFNPAFLRLWESMGIIRFKDWMRTDNSRITHWADRPTPNYCNVTERGVSVEEMVALCNRLGTTPWFCLPHRATDDYVRRFATYVRDHLDSRLKVYIEYSNELWSDYNEQTKYVNEVGRERHLADDPREAGLRYASLRSREIFDLWEQVFGGRSRLIRILGMESRKTSTGGIKLAYRNTHRYCDAIAIAPYFSMYITKESYPSLQTLQKWKMSELLDYIEYWLVKQATTGIFQHKKLANYYGLRLFAYEGGQQFAGAQGLEENEFVVRTLHTVSHQKRMGEIYSLYLNSWRTFSGHDVCCLYTSVSAWTKWGVGGLLRHMEDDTPKYRAVQDWIRQNPPYGTTEP